MLGLSEDVAGNRWADLTYTLHSDGTLTGQWTTEARCSTRGCRSSHNGSDSSPNWTRGLAMTCLSWASDRRSWPSLLPWPGHTWGLAHCAAPRCVMFFSNTLHDTDAKGVEFCSACRVGLPRSTRRRTRSTGRRRPAFSPVLDPDEAKPSQDRGGQVGAGSRLRKPGGGSERNAAPDLCAALRG